MTNALIVIEDTDRDRNLLKRARSFAVGDGSDLVVVALATPDEYEEIAATLDAIGRAEHTTYDEDAIMEGVSGDVDDVASDVLGDAVEYELRTVIAETDDQAEKIMAVAEQTGCDHVFLPGFRRSPTGKAIFGDRTQQVVLNFDGYVTVAMD